MKHDASRASNASKSDAVRRNIVSKALDERASERVGTGSTVTRSADPPIRRKTSISITHHRRRVYVSPASTSSSRQPAR